MLVPSQSHTQKAALFPELSSKMRYSSREVRKENQSKQLLAVLPNKPISFTLKQQTEYLDWHPIDNQNCFKNYTPNIHQLQERNFSFLCALPKTEDNSLLANHVLRSILAHNQ